MNAPSRDPLITVGSLKALAILLAVVWFFWPNATQFDRARLPSALVVATVCGVGWRFYLWHWHPFSGASAAWSAGERGRYVQRQLAQRDNLLQLSPQLFEDAIAQLFQVRHGWEVHRTRYAGDGGWDITVRAEGERMLVECKQYRPDKAVGRPALQKLHSAMVTEGVRRGFLITTSSFSEPARVFAAKTSIQLIDGAQLSQLMREAYGQGPRADVVHIMCTRCGALVEFKANGTAETTCANGHPVTNQMANLFRSDPTKGEGSRPPGARVA